MKKYLESLRWEIRVPSKKIRWTMNKSLKFYEISVPIFYYWLLAFPGTGVGHYEDPYGIAEITNSVWHALFLRKKRIDAFPKSLKETLRTRTLPYYIPYRGKFSSGKNFVGKKYSSLDQNFITAPLKSSIEIFRRGKLFVTWANFRYFSPTNFSPIRYPIKESTSRLY